jgi:hypothetical protein
MPTRARLTDAEIRAQIPAARARAKLERLSGLRARTVRYDRKAKRIVLELTSGYLFGVPVQALPDLADAHGEELAAVQLSSGGEAIRFPSLDADYSVPGLVLAMTAREVGRRGGQVRSEAKARAAKTNGAKGGRPRLSRT